MRWPLRTSAGITLPTSATIVCSNVFSLFGITKPNSNCSVSTSCPLKYIFWSIVMFSIFSADLNTIIRDIVLLCSILQGKCTSRYYPSCRLCYPSFQLGASMKISPVVASFIRRCLIEMPCEIVFICSSVSLGFWSGYYAVVTPLSILLFI